MTLEELRRSNKEQILRIAASYGARSIRIFGSVARGDNSPSDIDFLVEFHLEGMREDGDPIPEPTTHAIELSVEIPAA